MRQLLRSELEPLVGIKSSIWQSEAQEVYNCYRIQEAFANRREWRLSKPRMYKNT